ncbi:MAG: hypothetical protein QXE80_03595 [Pyrobaculum sp.]
MYKAQKLLLEKITKVAEQRKKVANVLPALTGLVKTRIISNAFQKLQRPEAVTSAITFTDQADDALKMFKITNMLLKAQRLEDEQKEQDQPNSFVADLLGRQ